MRRLPRGGGCLAVLLAALPLASAHCRGLDRAALIQPFNLAGWTATTRIVPPGLPDDPGMAGERWEGMDLEARRAVAAARVARWRAANGGSTPVLSAALPAGPGRRRPPRETRAIDAARARRAPRPRARTTRALHLDLQCRTSSFTFPAPRGFHYRVSIFKGVVMS